MWAPGQPGIDSIDEARRDIVLERDEGDGVFTAAEGPFTSYRRTVVRDASGSGDGATETFDFHLSVPWFGWLYWLPMRRALQRRPRNDAMPWWSPPDRLDQRAASVMGLLAAASLIVGYVNTLFTQTVAFAAAEFHVSKSAQGNAGSIVRAGIVLTLPLVFLADRWGRRRAMVVAAFAAPTIAMLGALAPSFVTLTATQTVARPLGLALDILIAVVATEEMPRSSRAYAVSVLAMATGLGAGFAVMALADLGPTAWRWIYALAAVMLVVASDLARRLPETRRFTAPHAVAPRYNRSRYRLMLVTAFFANIFVAPASFYQNVYLREVRGFSGGRISLFTLITATPIGLGILVGGRLADTRGRRLVGAVAVTFGAALLVASFAVGGWPMWTSGVLGGIVSGAAVPTLVVYRTELFPTAQRGRAGGLITASALVGGTIGLQVTGRLLDHHVGYGPIMASLGACELVVAALVLLRYPETAHLELEELNPEDRRH